MHHCGDRIGGEQRLEQRPVAHVALDEVQRPASQLLDAVERQLRAVAQIVQHQHLVAGLQQFEHCV